MINLRVDNLGLMRKVRGAPVRKNQVHRDRYREAKDGRVKHKVSRAETIMREG